MIEPKYLRTGDLVRVSCDCAFPKGTLCAVFWIHPEKSSKDKKGVVVLSYTDGTDDGPWGVWCCNIEGIPLTIEILEKNGWRLVNHKVDISGFEWKDYSREDGFVDVEYYPEIKNFAAFYCGQELRDIKYVHELQHILWALDEDSQLKM